MRWISATFTSRQAVPPAALCFAVFAVLISCAGPPDEKRHSDAEILMKRGDGYYFTNRYDEAVDEYSQAIEKEPGFAPAYRSRGYANLSLGEYAAAKSDFDRAVELSPDYSEAYFGRGMLLFNRGRYSEAIDDFDRVIELDPWNKEARYYKAIACEKIGRLREAVDAYKGYIHCSVPKNDATVKSAREKIRELERINPD